MLVERQLRFLTRFFTPRTIFMELGAGDCALALSAAGYVERVYAVEAEEIPGRARVPCNLKIVSPEAVAHGSVDIAYSARAADRDALERIHRSLAPGGTFFCIASHERAARKLRERFVAAGFRKVRFYAGIRGRFVRIPGGLENLFEEVRIAAVK